MAIDDRHEAEALAQHLAKRIAAEDGARVAGMGPDEVRQTLATEIETARKAFAGAVAPELAQGYTFDRAINQAVVWPAAAAGKDPPAAGASSSEPAPPSLAPPRILGFKEAKRRYAEATQLARSAELLEDPVAAKKAQAELAEILGPYQEAVRYHASQTSTTLALSSTAVGLAVCLAATGLALSGPALALLGLLLGGPLLVLGIVRLRYCRAMIRRALPPQSLVTTGTEGRARIVEVLAEAPSYGWGARDTAYRGVLNTWKLEVTLPGQAPYETIVETFHPAPPEHAAFPVYVDPNDAKQMYLGITQPA